MKRLSLIATVVTVLGSLGISHAAAQVIVAPPGAEVAGVFDGPLDVAVKGQPVTFVNLDEVSTRHNVESLAFGPDSAPWCGPNHFGKGFCPLFFSSTVAAGGTSTLDISQTVVGKTYAFVCAIHSNMKGELEIVN